MWIVGLGIICIAICCIVDSITGYLAEKEKYKNKR